MFYGIAVFPSLQIRQFANLYRKRYDSHYSLIEPHLTIREKEAWSDEELDEKMTMIQHNLLTVKPFELHFNRFSSFYPVSHVIYMALSNPKPLIRLHRQLCSGPLEEIGRPYTYSPHLTIAQGFGDDELHDILASLKNQPLNFQCRIDRITLLKQNDNGPWSVVREFML